jgi:hypothetical protein
MCCVVLCCVVVCCVVLCCVVLCCVGLYCVRLCCVIVLRCALCGVVLDYAVFRCIVRVGNLLGVFLNVGVCCLLRWVGLVLPKNTVVHITYTGRFCTRATTRAKRTGI